MIISYEYDFAFIHNPKVGGTSIRKALGKYHDDEGITYWHQGWDPLNHRVQDMAHIPRRDLPSHLRQWLRREKTFSFGFVRNPMTRFWSSLAEFRRQHSDWFPAQMETNEFIRTFLTEANVRHDWRFVHFCPQHYFFCEGSSVETTFIGKHENFQSDWGTAMAILQSRADVIVPELNNERHRVQGQVDPLNAESMEILHRLYDHDCRVFDYPQLVEDPSAGTHEYRVTQIHDPRARKSSALWDNLTDGERIAYIENTK